MTAEQAERVVYITHRDSDGYTQERKVLPSRVWFGSTAKHPDPQWLLDAYDIEHLVEHTLAVRDIESWDKAIIHSTRFYLAILEQPVGAPVFVEIFATSPDAAQTAHDDSLFGSVMCNGWNLAVIYEVRDKSDWLRLCMTHRPHGYNLNPKAYDTYTACDLGAGTMYLWSARLFKSNR